MDINVKIKLTRGMKLPEYATEGSAAGICAPPLRGRA